MAFSVAPGAMTVMKGLAKIKPSTDSTTENARMNFLTVCLECHFPHGLFDLAALGGVHPSEIEGHTEQEISAQDNPVHVFHIFGRGGPVQGFLLAQDIGHLETEGECLDVLGDTRVPDQFGVTVPLRITLVGVPPTFAPKVTITTENS